MKLMVTGSTGMTGTQLVRQARLMGHGCAAFSHQELDITDASAIETAVAQERPDVIVNAAAYTAVDAAEESPEAARKVNAAGARYVAQAARKHGAALIHISTDYVFDGTSRRPYATDDPTGPINVYGKSKVEGELAVREECVRHIILRSSWVYSDTGNNFVRTMLRLGAEHRELRVVNDQRGSPTAASDLAGALLTVAERSFRDAAIKGTFHFCNSGVTTWHEFASAIFELRGRRVPRITAISTSSFPAAARRPAFSALDTTTFERTFGVTPRPWRAALADTLALIP